jgi:hypothetical protein
MPYTAYMKLPLLITILFLTTQLPAQTTDADGDLTTWYNHESDTIKLFNKELQSMVQPAHGRFIAFSKSRGHITLKPDIQTTGLSLKYAMQLFRFDFLPGKELWQRKYGQAFPEELLLSKLDSIAALTDKRCDFHHFDGKIYPDSIVMEADRDCLVERVVKGIKPDATFEYGVEPVIDEDTGMIFIRPRDGIEYNGGKNALQRFLDEKLTGEKLVAAPTDSMLYFQCVIKKDSMIHSADLIEPNNGSAFSKKIADILTGSCNWLPYQKDGRSLSAHILLYVRLKRDGHIEADYPED